MLTVIRGAGDIATGAALRLWRSGIQVVMTDLPAPTAIRRTVCFSQAIVLGRTTVEDVTAARAETAEQAIDAAVRETISDFMEEHRVQKHKDNTVVNKVNRLKDAIEELSDGDDMDFSVAELSAYLDMSVEEIEDILRIAGEEP